LFTASYREYAERVLNKFDKNSQLIQNILTRENCTRHKELFIKDYRIIANKVSKDDIIMIDNKVISFGYNMHQGIPILPFYDDMGDTELRDILPFLLKLAKKGVVIKDVLKERYNYNRFPKINQGRKF